MVSSLTAPVSTRVFRVLYTVANDMEGFFFATTRKISSADGWLFFPSRCSRIASRCGVRLNPEIVPFCRSFFNIVRYCTIIDPVPPVKSYLGAERAFPEASKEEKAVPRDCLCLCSNGGKPPALFLSVLLRHLDP